MIIEIKNLAKKFDKEIIFNNLSFSMSKGELATIFSTSGRGKTTLLRLIAGLETPERGNIFLRDKLIFGDKTNIPPQKRHIGFVFQNYALFNHLSIKKNIAFGVKDKQSKKNITNELAKTFKIEKLLDKYPYQLSGGQQQRVAIARSLAPNNDFLLLDEPFSNLDEELKADIAIFLKKIFKERNITALLVTHNKTVAEEFSDNIYNLNDLDN